MESFRKRFRHNLTIHLLPYIGYAVVKVLALTMRFEEKGSGAIAEMDREGKPFIAAFWHGHLLMMMVSPYRRRSKTIISRHRDGEMISRAARLFGVGSVRGSTTEGGAQALKNAIRAIRAGYKMVVTPDGPRGPRHVVQPGVIELARVTGVPIIPVVFSSTRKKVFPSWDRFIFPLPFSKGVYFYGEPFFVERRIDREGVEAKRRELEEVMRQMTRQVENYCETGRWEDQSARVGS